jgi:hypothetical protein
MQNNPLFLRFAASCGLTSLKKEILSKKLNSFNF